MTDKIGGESNVYSLSPQDVSEWGVDPPIQVHNCPQVPVGYAQKTMIYWGASGGTPSPLALPPGEHPFENGVMLQCRHCGKWWFETLLPEEVSAAQKKLRSREGQWMVVTDPIDRSARA